MQKGLRPFLPAFAGEKPVKNRQKKAFGLFSRRKGFEKAFPAGFNRFKSSKGAFIPPAFAGLCRQRRQRPVGKEPLALFNRQGPALPAKDGKNR